MKLAVWDANRHRGADGKVRPCHVVESLSHGIVRYIAPGMLGESGAKFASFLPFARLAMCHNSFTPRVTDASTLTPRESIFCFKSCTLRTRRPVGYRCGYSL
ncbi:protein of unknown function (plasmid) [Cupriavidus taiwanensis]|uniref:Uncharacterized protein n=1 Tax=Cupriavidus taiwanensis TaxID=164546 RepID=A0A7Z7JIA5_9BURK|nr:hypothetical protein CBM2597_U30145 [Cupriavidus taiwanensis]SPC25830.1 hypothetical protein CBM2594_U20017 [Cupriavidus taiwanensis]SPD37840.1 protein of unknown function [Cupriavidus taiwanensis]SPD38145.1 protein of unknown function [Cupriavidus taiwanensis]